MSKEGRKSLDRFAVILLLTIALSVTGLSTNISQAHAASSQGPRKTTETKSLPLSKAFCDKIANKYHVSIKAGDCHATMTTTTTVQTGFKMQPHLGSGACPSGSILHETALHYLLWGVGMRETFTWDGTCGLPTVTNQNCGVGPWSLYPVTGVSITYCGAGADRHGNVIAEGDYSTTNPIGTDFGEQQSIANANNTNIIDTYNP